MKNRISIFITFVIALFMNANVFAATGSLTGKIPSAWFGKCSKNNCGSTAPFNDTFYGQTGMTTSCSAGYKPSYGGWNKTTFTVAANTYAIVDCEPEIYTITLNKNNGTGGLGSIYEKYNTGWYSDSTAATPLASLSGNLPSRNNYTFRGYYSGTSAPTDVTANTSSTANQKITKAGALPANTTFTADTTLYAGWAKNCTVPTNGSCTLTVANNGDVTYATSCNTGYTLSGNGTSTPTCTPNVYTITLDKQSGTDGTSTIYEKYGDGYYTDANATSANKMTTNDNSITIPTLSRYVFGGYYTSTNGGGTRYISETGYLTASASSTNFYDNTGQLHAKWVYTLSYNTNYPSGSSLNNASKTFTSITSGTQQTVKAVSDSNIDFTAPTGYTFGGWCINDTSCSGDIVQANGKICDTSSCATGSVKLAEPTTTGHTAHLNAKWTPNITVFLDPNRTAGQGNDGPIGFWYENTSTYLTTCSQLEGFYHKITSKNPVVYSDDAFGQTWGCDGDSPNIIIGGSNASNLPTNTATDNVYVFRGYYDNADGTGTLRIGANGQMAVNPLYLNDTNGMPATNPVTLYAKWEKCLPDNYKTTWGFTSKHIDDVTATIYENHCQYTIQCKSGYHYSSNDTTFFVQERGNAATANDFGACEPDVYTITLNTDGGTGGTAGPIYEKYGVGFYSNSSTTLQITTTSGIGVPSKTGFTFGGYYTCANTTGDSGCEQIINTSGKLVSNDLTTTFSDDGTLYAKWTVVTKTIQFNANGGSGTCAPVTCTFTDSDCHLRDWDSTNCNLTNGTNILFRWNTASNGSGTDYALNQDVISTLATVPTTLYAVWVDTECSFGSNTVESGTPLTPENNLARCEYICKMGYEPDTILTADAPGEVTLKYGCTEKDYTVTYNCGSGTGNPTLPTQTIHINDTFELKNAGGAGCTKTLNTFSSWSCEYLDTDHSVLANNTSYNKDADALCTAQWEPNIYTFTLDPHGGTGGTSAIYERYSVGWYYDSTATTSQISSLNNNDLPTRSGYTFRGYFYSAEADVNSNSFYTLSVIGNDGSLPSSPYYYNDTTLYAAWAQNCTQPAHGSCTLTINNTGDVTYSASCDTGYTLSGNGTATPTCTPIDYIITYDNDDGSCSGSDTPNCGPSTYNIEQSISLENPTKTHYDFAGWCRYDSSANDGNTCLTSDTTHYVAPQTNPESIIAIAAGSTGAKWFYAKYASFNIYYKCNINDETNKDIKMAPYLDTFTPESTDYGCTPEGYHFTGWVCKYRDGAGGVASSDLSSGSPYDKTVDAECIAQWAPNTININWWNREVGDTPDTQNTCDYGEPNDIDVPTAPERPGYTFGGWEIVSGN